MAPTKPLVLQQIEACQLTCGIPSTAAAVMTGETTSAAKRDRLVSFVCEFQLTSVGGEACVLLHAPDAAE